MSKQTLYELYLWPNSQSVIGRTNSTVVFPEESKSKEFQSRLDSAWLAPRGLKNEYGDSLEGDAGPFIKVTFPDSIAHQGEEGVLFDYDMACYVPVRV